MQWTAIGHALRLTLTACRFSLAKLVEGLTGAALRIYPGFDHGMCSTHKDEINRHLLGSCKAPRNRSSSALIRRSPQQEVCMKSDAKLISVNVGLPRVVISNGDPVST